MGLGVPCGAFCRLCGARERRCHRGCCEQAGRGQGWGSRRVPLRGRAAPMRRAPAAFGLRAHSKRRGCGAELCRRCRGHGCGSAGGGRGDARCRRARHSWGFARALRAFRRRGARACGFDLFGFAAVHVRRCRFAGAFLGATTFCFERGRSFALALARLGLRLCVGAGAFFLAGTPGARRAGSLTSAGMVVAHRTGAMRRRRRRHRPARGRAYAGFAAALARFGGCTCTADFSFARRPLRVVGVVVGAGSR